jgi:putative two-component system response regulator
MTMRKSTVAAAGVVAATALLLERQYTGRKTAERFAAGALETLLNAIDANDSETGAHVRRVATFALILADAAGLDQRSRRNVERVALFHDIGKIHAALFDIIHDHRTLTPAERQAVLTHPQRGADVLAPLNGFYPELPEGVLSHHERWNGEGYPRQLKGLAIPLSARIVAIADTFDAITFHRRYSRERPVEIARDIIVEGRGTLFDPDVVDLFVRPDVFARIVAAERDVASWMPPPYQRRTGEAETHVPDISFRWRPGRHGARGQPVSDRTRQSVR